MESYPGDLLAGVFPLVFAVDAILPASSLLAKGDEEEGKQEEEGAQDELVETSNSSTRSLFDRFLDAVASSLVDEEESTSPSRNGNDTIASLLRGEDKDEESDDEDDLSSRGSFRRNSPMSAFRTNKRTGSIGSTSTSYARALSSETFFQRARILSISTRHGFPPSKDPDGSNNRAFALSQARTTMAQGATGANALRLKSILDNQSGLDGILPAGWLEKHVHALPSVLLVVTTLSSNNQEAQNKHLFETMEHLRYNLAPKRQVHIHIVCLVEDPNASILTTDAWITLVRHETELDPADISLLSATLDLNPDEPTSPGLRQLHVTIRDASMQYYLQQARRTKRKLGMLGHERQAALLPLAVRYCFKCGIFYEFQLKHEKSLKFFAEAYRHVQSYYRFLLSGTTPEDDLQHETYVNPREDSAQSSESAAAEESHEVGIEVSLADASDDEEEEEQDEEAQKPPVPRPDSAKKVVSGNGNDAPVDMTHQCRAVADWLNFKLLQAGFLSSAFGESEGLLAASWQWRRHCQVMLRQEDPANPPWNHWSYVAHQRLVMSQLAERHPPYPGVTEEILVRCSPWRNYQAAAEAVLLLAAEIRKELSEKDSGSADKHAGRSMRKKYVGGFDSEGLSPKFEEESKQNLAERALELANHAIVLLEHEVQTRAAEDDDNAKGEAEQLTRAGGRLYYITGGILLSVERPLEAVEHLKKVELCCSGWRDLESAVRRMLVRCYEKHPPPVDKEETESDAIVLDSYFNAGLSSDDLQSALKSLFESRGCNKLEWPCSTTEESSSLLPFMFSVTFPGSSHATAGDAVTASVQIKSNLNYPVCVKSVSLSSDAGNVAVPASDLVRAAQDAKGDDGSIIISGNAPIVFTTNIILPKELSESGKKEGKDAKSNAIPSARPRTAGLTSGAGARLVSEERFGPGGSAQWSKTLLGGKPLLCDAMRLLFFPVHDEKNAASILSMNLIEVSIQKKKPKTAAPAKRTPFEENNFVESAWSRPAHLPLSRGPRCLRVLGPMAHMEVTNLTDQVVNGKALEGTVNRIVFKLQAGPGERCHDLKYRVTCSSMILSSDGTTTHLTPEEGVPESTEPVSIDEKANVQTAKMRTPVAVLPDESSSIACSTEFGYQLPVGWKLLGTGQRNTEELSLNTTTLEAGEATYMCVELYRPPRPLKSLESYDDDSKLTGEVEDGELCQTDFDIAVTYRQSRSNIRQQRGDPSQEQVESDSSDSVVLEYSGSVTWESPISAEFPTTGRSQSAFPSGSRHPSNYVSFDESDAGDGGDSELALINGERTSARCILQSAVASNGLNIEIAELRFEEKDSSIDTEDTGCEMRLMSGLQTGSSGILYVPAESDCTRKLAVGAKFGFTYVVEPKILAEYIKGSVSTCLGVICVDWLPVSLKPPKGCEAFASHGPLRINRPPTLKFRGPPCYIEDSPFETVLESLPPAPRVATPFEMTYRISNKTGVNQKLSVSMSDDTVDDRENSTTSEGVLVSGLMNGDIHLAPFETQKLSYTALATRAGKTTMPSLSISSERYRTWVLKASSQVVYVLP